MNNLLGGERSPLHDPPPLAEEQEKGYKTTDRSELTFGDVIFLEGVFNQKMEKGVVVSRDSETVEIYGPSLDVPLNSQTYLSESLFRLEKEGQESLWYSKRVYATEEILLRHVQSDLYLQLRAE